MSATATLPEALAAQLDALRADYDRDGAVRVRGAFGPEWLAMLDRGGVDVAGYVAHQRLLVGAGAEPHPGAHAGAGGGDDARVGRRHGGEIH